MRFILSFLFVVLVGNVFSQKILVRNLIGAWQSSEGDTIATLIFSETCFSAATYDLKNKKFITTNGGKWVMDGNTLVATYEFDVNSPERIGGEMKSKINIKGNALTLTNDNSIEFKRLDNGVPGKLAGAWLITGRMSGDEMRSITPGDRKTMKILSGTRFQWIAYNSATKEFLGTGGGTYTTNDGKYVENIEFFSRDNSKVGASLTFDFSIEDGKWHHTGFSSKGDPIDEVWSRREEIEKKN